MAVVLLGAGGVVDGPDEPVERPGVHLLGEGIAPVSGGVDAERYRVAVPSALAGRDGPVRQRLGNVPGGNAEECRQPFQFAGRRDDGPILIVRIDPERQLS